MAERSKITLTTIKNMPVKTLAWDAEVRGFYARRQNGPDVAYGVFYRAQGHRQRWAKIGRHGAPWTPDAARKEAQRILALVAAGSDPAGQRYEDREAPTVEDLCVRYQATTKAGRVLTRNGSAKKASTLLFDRGAIQRHIVPLIGSLKVAAVTRRDVERFRDDVTEGKTAGRFVEGPHAVARVSGGAGIAARALGLLGAIFSFAIEQGLRSDNPVRGIRRRKDGSRTRRATEAEYAQLGDALRSAPGDDWPIAIAATRFLALSGWRRGEMVALKWSEVDLATRTANLVDTKTGGSMRPLSRVVAELLHDLPKLGGPLVFPSGRGAGAPMNGFNKVWRKIAARAGLPGDVSPHVLRHSFASVALDLGYSELTIGAMLGHRKASVTSRYAHHADAVLLAAADKVAARIDELLGFEPAPGVVIDVDFKSVA